MSEGSSLADAVDEVRPDGVLDRVRVRVVGIPMQVLAYFHILGALGAGGYRDQDLGLSGGIDYGDEHFTCFQFGYDWRRDISETAVELGKFIEEKREYVKAEMTRRYGVTEPEVQFDIVAHSMGGLVARYYLRYGATPLPEDGSLPELSWAGAKDVENVVLVGTPNAGSVKALDELIHGARIGPTLPRYGPTILGTMPAAYQLLPRARHGAVVVRDGAESKALDLFDLEVWEQMGWGLASTEADETLAWLLPDARDNAERRRVGLDHLRKSLRRARQFAEAMDLPAALPEGTFLYLIAGDSKPTPATAEVEAASGKLRIAGTAPGDGTVLRSSALMDERLTGEWSPRLVTPIDWSQVVFLFRDHLDLTRSQEFTDNVLYVLLEQPTGRPGSEFP
jgi:pimeloyl-ACP methyl ester carboxylesterase